MIQLNDEAVHSIDNSSDTPYPCCIRSAFCKKWRAARNTKCEGSRSNDGRRIASAGVAEASVTSIDGLASGSLDTIVEGYGVVQQCVCIHGTYNEQRMSTLR